MGCVLGREVSSGIVSGSKEVKNLSVEPKRKLENVSVTQADTNSVVEIQNEETQKEDKVDGEKRPRGDRRRSRPNPRQSNLPKHLRGEQVAPGWPPWLSAVCGEALNGWIPRRADTFEKIDKVGVILRMLVLFNVVTVVILTLMLQWWLVWFDMAWHLEFLSQMPVQIM